jgi:hypothetical protein
MATLVSNSMGVKTLWGGHFGMVIKVNDGRRDGMPETNVLRSIDDAKLSASDLAEWHSAA